MDSAINNTISASLEINRNHNFYNFTSVNETQTIEDARKSLRKASGVFLGVGSLVLSSNPALAIALGSIIYNGSKMNRKSEKLLQIQNYSEVEARFIQLGLFADFLGVLRNFSKIGMDGFGFLPEVLRPIRMFTNVIGIPLKLYLKSSNENRKRFERMSMPEQTFEGASMGVYVWKLQVLFEELSRVSG